MITISRKWNNPQIDITVNPEGIELSCSIPDFAEALATEIGPVTWVFRDATFRARFDAAVAKVISGIKEESVKAV